MTSDPRKPFRWSDAWLFESISLAAAASGREAAPLAQVLLFADGVNKTPISSQELNGGVSRLERAGYVMLHADMSLSLTPTGMALLAEARAAWTGEPKTLTIRHAVERILGADPWTPKDDLRTAGDDRELISREAMQAAEKAYRKQLRKELRESR